MKYLLLLLISIMCPALAPAQQDTLSHSRDVDIATAYFAQFAEGKNQSPQKLMVETALFFLDRPYVASTLDKSDEEALVVNLRELDCTTFVETCMALCRAVQSGYPDYDSFCKELQRLRYRRGIIDGYESRLHYISDWITDNSQKGIIEDVSHAIGGKKLLVNLNYMSTHPDAYKQLKGNPERVENMRKIEKTINAHQHYYFLPKQDIRSKQRLIKDGDIVCFTTSMAGMDVSHVGIAYWQKGVLTFIHASYTFKKVIINPESLEDYCFKSKSNTGIIVLSVNAPTQTQI